MIQKSANVRKKSSIYYAFDPCICITTFCLIWVCVCGKREVAWSRADLTVTPQGTRIVREEFTPAKQQTQAVRTNFSLYRINSSPAEYTRHDKRLSIETLPQHSSRDVYTILATIFTGFVENWERVNQCHAEYVWKAMLEVKGWGAGVFRLKTLYCQSILEIKTLKGGWIAGLSWIKLV